MSVKCPICKESFRNANGVVRHAKKKHPPRFPRQWQDEFAEKVIKILNDTRSFDLEKYQKIRELMEKDKDFVKGFLAVREDARDSMKRAKSS